MSNHIDTDKMKDLKIALLERQLIQMRGQALLKEVEQSLIAASTRVTHAFEAAGLDPALTYNIDFESGVVTPVEA